MDFIKYIPRSLLKHKLILSLCRLNLQNRYCKCRFNNHSTAFIDLLDPEPRNIFITGIFEPFFYEIALAFIPHNGTVFDLGANVGFCSFGLVHERKSANYHLFEANSDLVELISMSANLPENSNSVFFNNHGCLAQNSGFSFFHLQSDQSGQSHTALNSGDGVKVKNLVLDDYCISKNVSFVDFAKIDIEGQEFPAIIGWKNFLAQKSVGAIFMESFPRNVIRYGIDINEPLLYLENLGYNLYLCKQEDFASFAEKPKEKEFPHGKLKVAKFEAKNYPDNFSTEILAVAT
jgi:FkbM family methyltransferase